MDDEGKMYLKKLIIKNFRIFDETGIELIFNEGVNAIIGENNSGKSSVIDVLKIVYSTVTYRKDIFFQSRIFILSSKNISLPMELKRFGQFIGRVGQKEINYLQIHLRQQM